MGEGKPHAGANECHVRAEHVAQAIVDILKLEGQRVPDRLEIQQETAAVTSRQGA